MENLPTNWVALLMMVFVLGIKHGMDPDHLATIDGIARFNYGTNPRLARRTGILFSLGHGMVVILIAVTVGVLAKKWEIPGWLEGLGAWISILFLFSFAALNFHAVLRAPAGQMVKVVGLKGQWLGRLTQTSHPLVIVLVGALFALSFDTISQAALFSLAASTVAGWGFSIVVGVAFLAGMLVTDGLNGLWMAHLLSSADRRAIIASRVMGLTVAGLSLLVGIWGVAKYFSYDLGANIEGSQFLIGCGVVGVVTLSFILALHLSRIQGTPVPLSRRG